jgi:hypothetical protein
MKSNLMITAMVLVFLILAAGLASAGLGTNGAKLDKEVAPGEHLTHLMQVKTDASDLPMDINVTIFGFGQYPQGANRELIASQDLSPYTARPFLTVSPVSFHLDPGKTQAVTLEGNIPKDVGAGSRYALVKFHTGAMGKGMIGFKLIIDVPILLTISGSEILDRGEIENISLEQPISADKQRLSLLFKNTGNNHYNPLMEAVVKDRDGNIASNVSIPSPISILPTYSRLFKADLNPKTPLKPGTYNLNATVSLDGKVLATKEVPFEVKS